MKIKAFDGKKAWLTMLICTTMSGCGIATDDGNAAGDINEASSATTSEPKTEIDNNSDALKQKVGKTPLPEDVVFDEIPEFPADRLSAVQNGIAYLTKDDRIHVTDKGYRFYNRFAYEVIDRKGLETAAQISHTFDPESGNLDYHFVRVIRDGKVDERLSGLEIQEMRREDELSDGLVDGDITALMHLEDVKVGDVIEYAYSGYYESLLWPGHFFSNVGINYSVPIARQTYGISVPKSRSIDIEAVNTRAKPTITEQEDRTLYSFEISNPELEKSFANVPDGVFTSAYLLISTMQSWQEVADWGVEVYDMDLSLPDDYRKTVKALKKQSRNRGDQMAAALKLVQNDIRYLGIESGVNSHKPREPKVTLSKGYGDCKDKTQLLISVLRELGIKAHPALVSISSGKILPQLLPSINNFDHVIVMAEVGEKIYWLDPTLTFQEGNADTLVVPDYGYVLPLKERQTDLVEITVSFPNEPTSEVLETYRLNENETLNLNVVSTYRGADADTMRRRVKREGIDGLSKSYLNYYVDFYPGLSGINKINVKDNTQKNEFVLTEAYELSTENYEKNGIAEKLYVKASTISGQLPTKIEADRDIKVGLNDGVFFRHVIAVETPGREFVAPVDETSEVSGVTYSRNFESEDEVLTIEYVLKIEEPSVGLSDVREIIELADKISSEIELDVNPTYAKERLSKRLGLGVELSETMEADLTKIGTHIKAKENVEALEMLNSLSAEYKNEDALRGYIHLLRGAVLIDLDRSKAAIKDFDIGFALHNPDAIDPYFRYAGLLGNEERDIDAAVIMGRLFEKFPEASKTVRYEWLWRLAGKLFRDEKFDAREDLIISIAKAQLEYLDEISVADRMVDSAIPIFVRRGEVNEAKPFLEYLESPSDIRDILIDNEMKAIWPDVEDIAGVGLTKAIKKFIETTKEQASPEEADFKTKSRYLNALFMAGEFETAKSFAEETLKNKSKVHAVGMDAYWFINSYAYLLSSSGEYEKADQVFDDLLEDRLYDEPQLVNMAINQVSMLRRIGNYDKVISLVENYEANEEFSASDYGWMFLHQSRACAMAAKGNLELASSLYYEKTKETRDDNIAIHFLALLCLNEDDDAAEIMKERLRSERHRSGTLPVFSTSNAREYANDFERDLFQKIKDISKREDVQKVFKEYGRSIHIDGAGAIWEEW